MAAGEPTAMTTLHVSTQLEQLNGRLEKLAADIAIDREQQAERIRRAVREAVSKEITHKNRSAGEVVA